MEAVLTRSRTVLTHNPEGRLQTVVYFDRGADEEPNAGHLNSIDIPRQMWKDLGQPDKLTITIEPGDKLNEENWEVKVKHD